MTTVALGPYEHAGAYSHRAESEVFETAGITAAFCIQCEHEPCVAGGTPYCTSPPRFIGVEAIREEISDLKCKVATYGHPLWKPFTIAVSRLGYDAWSRGPVGDYALAGLVAIRAELRQSLQEQS